MRLRSGAAGRWKFQKENSQRKIPNANDQTPKENSKGYEDMKI
jgi:hypothetical protein